MCPLYRSGFLKSSAFDPIKAKSASVRDSVLSDSVLHRRLCHYVEQDMPSPSETLINDQKRKLSNQLKLSKLKSSKKVNFKELMLSKYLKQLNSLTKKVSVDIKITHQQLYELSPSRNSIIDSLRTILCGSGRRSLVTVGSSKTGLGTKSSDIDLVLITSMDAEKRDAIMKSFSDGSFRKMYLEKTHKIIFSSSLRKEFINSRTLILPHAYVPILHLQTRTGIGVDIQFDQLNSIKNTLFLHYCVMEDIRVEMLNLWVKKYLSVMGLKNSKLGLFSSYHIALIVIYFLEHIGLNHENPILPLVYNVYNNHLDRSIAIEDTIAKINNIQLSANPAIHKVGSHPEFTELLINFIDYFSSIELNTLSLSAETGRCTSRPRHLNLEISDPYSSTVCRVANGSGLFMDAFRSAKRNFVHGRGLSWPIQMTTSS